MVMSVVFPLLGDSTGSTGGDGVVVPAAPPAALLQPILLPPAVIVSFTLALQRYAPLFMSLAGIGMAVGPLALIGREECAASGGHEVLVSHPK